MLLSDRVHRGLSITKHKFNIFIRSDKCCLRTGRIACRGDLWQKSALPRKSCNADSTCFAFWSPTNIWWSNYCPWPLTLGERISRPALEEVDIVSAEFEHGPSHECTWLVVLDYWQGHRTSVHDLQVLQVLHNNVVFNQIVKNCQHQPCQSLFLIKVFQLSDATHICKPSGRKWLEIRVC